MQPIRGEALLSSVILDILLTLAVGSVRMLQLRRLAKRPPWWSGDGAPVHRDGSRTYGKCRRKITTLEN